MLVSEVLVNENERRGEGRLLGCPEHQNPEFGLMRCVARAGRWERVVTCRSEGGGCSTTTVCVSSGVRRVSLSP